MAENIIEKPTEKEVINAIDVLLRAVASEDRDIVEYEVSDTHIARFEVLEKDKNE